MELNYNIILKSLLMIAFSVIIAYPLTPYSNRTIDIDIFDLLEFNEDKFQENIEVEIEKADEVISDSAILAPKYQYILTNYPILPDLSHVKKSNTENSNKNMIVETKKMALEGINISEHEIDSVLNLYADFIKLTNYIGMPDLDTLSKSLTLGFENNIKKELPKDITPPSPPRLLTLGRDSTDFLNQNRNDIARKDTLIIDEKNNSKRDFPKVKWVPQPPRLLNVIRSDSISLNDSLLIK